MYTYEKTPLDMTMNKVNNDDTIQLFLKYGAKSGDEL